MRRFVYKFLIAALMFLSSQALPAFAWINSINANDPIRASDIDELRIEANNRISAACGTNTVLEMPPDASIGVGLPIKASHLISIRTKVGELYLAKGIPLPGAFVADGPAILAGQPILASHITNIRSAIDGLCVCGNGVVEAGEACDTGAARGACPASCSATCTNNICAVCGNGTVEAGEACDTGAARGACPATCSAGCTVNSCACTCGPIFAPCPGQDCGPGWPACSLPGYSCNSSCVCAKSCLLPGESCVGIPGLPCCAGVCSGGTCPAAACTCAGGKMQGEVMSMHTYSTIGGTVTETYTCNCSGGGSSSGINCCYSGCTAGGTCQTNSCSPDVGYIVNASCVFEALPCPFGFGGIPIACGGGCYPLMTVRCGVCGCAIVPCTLLGCAVVCDNPCPLGTGT